ELRIGRARVHRGGARDRLVQVVQALKLVALRAQVADLGDGVAGQLALDVQLVNFDVGRAAPVHVGEDLRRGNTNERRARHVARVGAARSKRMPESESVT